VHDEHLFAGKAAEIGDRFLFEEEAVDGLAGAVGDDDDETRIGNADEDAFDEFEAFAFDRHDDGHLALHAGEGLSRKTAHDGIVPTRDLGLGAGVEFVDFLQTIDSDGAEAVEFAGNFNAHAVRGSGRRWQRGSGRGALEVRSRRCHNEDSRWSGQNSSAGSRRFSSRLSGRGREDGSDDTTEDSSLEGEEEQGGHHEQEHRGGPQVQRVKSRKRHNGLRMETEG